MKKILPCLAVAALMVTGCAPSTKVSEKKFDEEVTNYGCFLNNNVEFKGTARMGDMEMELTLDSDSDGQKINLGATLKYLGDDVEVDTMKAMIIGEAKNDKFNGNMYTFETEWVQTPVSDFPMEDLKEMLVEFTYLAPVRYESVKYDSSAKAYVFNKFVATFPDDGDSEITITFRDGELAFKNKELVSYKYEMSVGPESINLEVNRAKKGGVKVEAPSIS